MESKREKENAGQKKRLKIGKLLNISYHLLKYNDVNHISIR